MFLDQVSTVYSFMGSPPARRISKLEMLSTSGNLWMLFLTIFAVNLSHLKLSLSLHQHSLAFYCVRVATWDKGLALGDCCCYCTQDLNCIGITVTTMSCRLQYNQSELLSLKHAQGTATIQPVVFNRLKDLGILHLRSRRGGHHIRRNAQRRHDTKASFCAINAQSIRNKTTEFVEFVVNNKLDIVAVSETWLRKGDDVIVGDITPDGYCIKQVPRSASKRGGGIALLYKQGFDIRFTDLGITHKSFEYLSAEIVSSTLSMTLVTIYRPQQKSTGSSFSDFLDELAVVIDNALLKQMPLLVTGDFNVHIDNQDDRCTKAFLRFLSSNGLQQHIHGATHRKGHTLDLLITRESDPPVIHNLDIIDGISDHSAITGKIDFQRPPAQTRVIKSRNLSAVYTPSFCEDILNFGLLDDDDGNLLCQVQRFNSALAKTLNDHAPMKERVVRLHPNPPWFHEGIRKGKKVRHQLETKWRKSRLHVDQQNYLEQKRKVTHDINVAKSQYYNDLFMEHAKDQRQIFRLTDKLLHKQRKSSLPKSESNQDMAQRFSHFFTDKIKKIREGFQIMDNLHDPPNNSTSTQFFEFDELSHDDFNGVISKSPNKACELDPIPTSLLKQCGSAIFPAMMSIIKKSLQSGEVPPLLKVSKIHPVLKKSNLDPNEMSNYRPVSNLCFLGKTLERVVSKQLTTYLVASNLLDDRQSAYRANHSVETAVVKVQNDLLLAMNNGKISLFVALDLSAAFDTVDHDVLLSRLNSRFGITGIALEWFRSYISERTCYVGIHGAHSEISSLQYGLPQGSVLGPLLFCMYTRPLADIIQRHGLSYHCYADDTQIYVSVKPVQSEVTQALHLLEACLDELRQWMTLNFLKLNDSKTEFMIIGSKQQLSKVDVTGLRVGEATVTPVDSVRNLGVIFDSNLSMDDHITNVSRAACLSLRNIGLIRKHINKPVAELLIHAYITSRLDMCNALLFNLSKSQLNRLQRKQNQAARLVTLSRKYSSITPIMKQLHWLPIDQRIIYKISLLVFKAIHGKSPSYIRDLIQPYVPARDHLRSAADKFRLVEHAGINSWGSRSFQVAAGKVWNGLPHSIRAIQTIDTFKSTLKTHLFSKTFQ